MNEKNINTENKQDNPRKNIGDKVSHLINKILSEPNQDFGDRINYVINKVLDSIPTNIKDNKKLQKEIFDQIYEFLNKTFKDIDVKKFYNSIPNIDIGQYAGKDLGNQFVNNIYGKQWKIFYRDQIKGGSCHHRTIFFKKLFDELEARGFDIQSRIVDTGHSAVILKFLGEKYFVDMYSINDKYKKVISTAEFLNKKEKTKIFSKFSFNKEKDKGMIYFDDVYDFVKDLKDDLIDTATIEFKPRLEDGQEKDIRIELAKDYIALIIDGDNKNIKKYRVNKMIIPDYFRQKPEILEFILKNIDCQKESKCEIAKYFQMIRNKINPEKIYEIFNDKKIK